MFDYVYQSEISGTGQAVLSIDKNKTDVLEYAFIHASQAGNPTWAYIDGIMNRLRQRGLNNLEDCEVYDIDRTAQKY